MSTSPSFKSLTIDGEEMISRSEAYHLFREVTGYPYSPHHIRVMLDEHPSLRRVPVGAGTYFPVADLRTLAQTLTPPRSKLKPEELEAKRLKALRLAETPGMTIPGIAEALDLSVSQVRKWIRSLTEDEREQIRQTNRILVRTVSSHRKHGAGRAVVLNHAHIRDLYLQSGGSLIEVARTTGHRRSTIAKIVRDLMNDPERIAQAKKEREELAARVLALRQQGWKLDQIAQQVGKSTGIISQLLPEDERQHYREYTDEERAAAIKRVEQGEPVDLVAQDMDIVEGTLRSWTTGYFQAKRGKRPAHAPEAVKQRARELRAQDYYLTDIAEIVGYHLSTVSAWVKPILPRWSQEDQQAVVARLNAGEEAERVAHDTGIPATAIIYWYWRQRTTH